MDPIEFETIQGLIERAAERVYWGFANQAANAGRTPPIEWEDCVQEGWAAYMAGRETLVERLDSEHGRAYVRLVVRRAIANYARREKAERAGYAVEDEAFYSAPLVRSLLPLMLETASDQVGVGTDGHTELVDVQRGYAGLCYTDQVLLWDVYGPQCLTELDSDMRRAASRAVGRLRTILNGQP